MTTAIPLLLHFPRPRLRASLAAILAVCAAGFGCAALPSDPAEKPPAVAAPLPPAIPKTTGVETAAAREHRRLAAAFGGEYRSPALERLLNDVLIKLAPASDVPGEPYKVTILNTPVVNAFALPSGDLFVTRGLLALANDTSEVAAVMAHEIGHVTARHAAQRSEMERTSALVGRVVSDVLEKPEQSRKVAARYQLSLASFSRQQELEADQIGIRVISRAGYDPYGAVRFLELLGRSTSLRSSMLGQKTKSDQPDINATHPSTPERVAKALAVARQIGAPGIGDAGREPCLRAINGLSFGDDPSEGFIRGRSFIHPRLGFAFVAPDGFVLENSAQAVLGIAAGGSEALRLDSVRVQLTTTLQAYLTSGWIEGIKPSSVQILTINGLPAATAVARGSEWNFRLAAIRFGTDVYRIIFATRRLTDAQDDNFRTSISTFHRVTAEEIASAKPTHIAIVTAGLGDTAESLAGKMALQDRPVDYFLLLNGLERASDVRQGERYKIVVE